ncbi:MAG TPA: RES family NAD+ phosphorylase [Mycobacteriales bacterium]
MTFPGRPRLVDVPEHNRWLRIYDARFYADGAKFRYFGPHRAGRFDHHPAGPARRHPHHGVLYATESLRCAVAEAFGDDRWVDPLPSHRLAVIELDRALRLADTRGDAAVELGRPAGALRSRDRALTQQVARALYDATPADGISYEGWFTGDTCVALWERAADAVRLVDDRSLTDPWVADAVEVAADTLHYARP